VSGDAFTVVDGDAAAFDPDGPTLWSEDLIVDDADGVCVDRSLGVLLDVEEVGRPDDFVQIVNRRDFGAGTPVDGIGALAEFDCAFDEIHLPCGDAGGLLDEGESRLLIEEDLAGDAFGGNVAEEQDDSVLKRAALDGEPEVEGVRVEGLKFAGNAFVHCAEKVTTDFLVLPGDGELIPEVFAEKFAFRAEEFFGAAVEVGDVPVAVDAGDRVGGGLEDLAELADGGVAKEFGAFSVGNVVIVEGNAFVGWVDGDVKPGVDAFGVVLDVAFFACRHDVAIELLEISAEEVWVNLPVRPLAVYVGWSDATAETCFLVGKGYLPVSIDADDSFRDLSKKAGEALVSDVVLAPAGATSLCWVVDLGEEF
jgi:hypothetical protein